MKRNMSNSGGQAWIYNSTAGGVVKNLCLTDYHIQDNVRDHVLIEMLNVSLNPADYKFPVMPVASWFIKRPASTGMDFCGRIRALSSDFVNDARGLHIGQVVFGLHQDIRSAGTLKTIMWVHKDSLYPLPDNIPVGHGSALGVAALTAYHVLSPYAKANNKVLINGGSGGVGTFAIQMAKDFGMYVIVICSEAGAQLCKDLGADETLNYKSPTFYHDLCRTKVDLVIDNVGHDPKFHKRSEGFLKPDGQFVLVALMEDDWAGISSMLVSWLCPAWLGGPARKWKYKMLLNGPKYFAPVAEMVSEGKIKIVIDTIFPFSEAPKAFEKLQSGRAKGKILVDVSARNM